jgi:hypothetical protein
MTDEYSDDMPEIHPAHKYHNNQTGGRHEEGE